jgi:hypothetical protein
MTQWFVAKYMPDLRRREPRNVGVILFAGDRILSRFLGEDPRDPGKIDGRMIRHRVGSSDNYRDWIHFWRTIAPGRPEQVLVRRPTDNYYVERGGQRLSASATEPEALLDRLYLQIVATDDGSEELPEAPQTDPVAQLFESVASTLPYTKDYVVDLSDDEHVFDYAVKAVARVLLFRHVVLNGSIRKTWDAVHTAVAAVRDVTEAAPVLDENPEPYVIVTKVDAGPGAPKQMRALEHKVGPRLRKTEGLDADREWLLHLAGTLPIPVSG